MREFVIFDLDGTLVDSNGICVEILQEMLDERGSPARIDAGAAARHMSLGGAAMVRAVLAADCGDPDAELRDFRARYAARATAVESLFAGVDAGLGRLVDAGFVLAICSNKPDALCAKVLADTGLRAHFRAVVGGAPSLRPKPAPDLLRATLARLGVDAARCVFVGDSELDGEMAAAAGMPFCFMTYGYAHPAWTPPAGAYRFDDFATLVDTLLTHGPSPPDG